MHIHTPNLLLKSFNCPRTYLNVEALGQAGGLADLEPSNSASNLQVNLANPDDLMNFQSKNKTLSTF